ncbi:MAG: hypothetical protein R3297_07555 [Desulfobulbales bacterium]|nr:hypothetical protein [Desulfobulbales bacterium]
MRKMKLFLMMSALMLPLVLAGCSGKNLMHKMGVGGHADMKMHHIHSMMNHGLSMVTEGSNAIMVSYMDMAPKVDDIAHEHGHDMMNMGKGVINRSLSGPEMMSMMDGDQAHSEHMNYTHKLGESMLIVVDLLEKMAKTGTVPKDMMTMHHQHLLINHAMSMAAQGANMVMLGEMGMAGDIDAYSADHGRMMLNNANALLAEVMSGGAMMEMHAKGKTPEGHGGMTETHKLGEAALKVVDLLANMPKM